MRKAFVLFSLISVAGIALLAYFIHPSWSWTYLLILPIVLIGSYDMVQTHHAIMRNFPILGRGRYVMEEWRPKLYQYFIESDTNGTPINRIYRSVAYQRAKDVLDTSPFGTQLDVYEEGYEWMNHSIGARDAHSLDRNPTITVGGPQCQQPYRASILNISAMSYGSLSGNAVQALNGGASIGGFAHNTGEGSISSHHLRFGGDLIYQLGTGYFGSRDAEGNFSAAAFRKRAALDVVKMVEIKLSQGAKPGHGGILPGKKNTPEIAEIRGVTAGEDILSPPYHKAFSTPRGLLDFVQQLRDLSEGKPVGFKLCIGHRSEFLAICKAMVDTGIYPDFITVDGGEGGTGAAPLEFANSVGMPFREALAFAYDALVGFDLKQHIKIFTAGKVITGFHMFRAFALGADACYSARAMMLALGCIQALECNKNSCPTGVTTLDPQLMSGLVVSDKKGRVANFHRETVQSMVELLGAAGIESPQQISRHHVLRRVSPHGIQSFAQIYPYLEPGCLLRQETVPEDWRLDWRLANAESFIPKVQQPVGI